MTSPRSNAAYSLLARGLALFASALFALSMGLHVVSLAGVDVQARWPGVFWLQLVVVGAGFSLLLTRGLRGRSLDEVLPGWAGRLFRIAFFYAIANFVLNMVQTHGAVPGIQGGQYALHSHGHIVRLLSEQEWHHFRALELRGFSSYWMLFSLLVALMWANEAQEES